MDEIRFSFEWTPGDGVAARELAATWARLELWVGEECVTTVEDIDTGSARRSIYCPLYPLAEWVGFNWWLLQANTRPAAVAGALADRLDHPRLAHWNKHHNMRAAGDGFRWPNFVILPEGRTTRVVWRPDRRQPLSPIRYLPGGEAFIDASQTTHVLAELVELVLARLDEQGISDSVLANEWRAITAASQDERDFCIAAARLGLDPYTLDDELAARLESVGAELSDTLLADFLDSVAPASIEGGLRWVDRVSRLIGQLEIPPDARLETLRMEAPRLPEPTDPLPWERGYRQATDVRSLFGLEPTQRFDASGMVTIKKRDSEDRGLQALGGLTPSDAGTLILGRHVRQRDSSFAVARSLWHFAFDNAERFLLTTAHADRQRVERSFAAELLAPAAGLNQVLNVEDGLVTTDDVSDAAEHFGVAPFVVRHQIENQLGLSVA
jgi:hypothetical protein